MSVWVVCGANSDRFPLEGRTIANARRALKDAFNISPKAFGFLNGEKSKEETILDAGDRLEFSLLFGRKGGSTDYWSESEMIHHFGEDTLRKMTQAGLEPELQAVFTDHQIRSWTKWLGEQNDDPNDFLDIQIDIEKETIVVEGKSFQIDQQCAAVVKCLLEANGERRSTTDMKQAYPKYIFDERLDLTIKRKLINHASGVGDLITSDKKGYRLLKKACE